MNKEMKQVQHKLKVESGQQHNGLQAFSGRGDGDKPGLQASNTKQTTASKLLTFALLLAVPAVMTGCNTSSNCNPEYENCSTGSGSGGGGYYYGGSSGSKSSGSYSTESSSSSGAYKGLGSSGISSSGG